MGEFERGSGLEVPGIEAVIEYGDWNQRRYGRLPGTPINDHSRMERFHVSQIDGLHDDPDGRDSARTPNAERHGESAGPLLYSGRTIGLSGDVRAGSITAMRDTWRRVRAQFGERQRDLIFHPVGEVRELVNEVQNPRLTDDTFGWGLQTPTGNGTVTGPEKFSGTQFVDERGARIRRTGTTGAGVMEAISPPPPTASTIDEVVAHTPWQGEDAWIGGWIAVAETTAASVTSISVELIYYRKNDDGTFVWGTTGWRAAQNSPAIPVSGSITKYFVQSRILSSQITTNAQALGIGVRLTNTLAGTYSLLFSDLFLVLLEPGSPTPVGYFDGGMAGYEYDGVPERSKSRGPKYSVNQIPDPALKGVNSNDIWTIEGVTGGDATALALPKTPERVFLEGEPAMFVSLQKDATATQRAFYIEPQAASSAGMYEARSGRTYRWTVKLRVISAWQSTFDIALQILWVDESGAVQTTTNSAPLAQGSEELVFQTTAPSNRTHAFLRLRVQGFGISSSTFQAYLFEPCYVDVSEFPSQESFFGKGLREHEGERFVRIDPIDSIEVRRRIPRPFMLRRVRKVPDAKQPDRQNDDRPRRPATMALRAADPRVYVADPRVATGEMTGAPTVSTNASIAIGPLPTEPALSTVPTGFTYEGHNTPAGLKWSPDAWNAIDGYKKPVISHVNSGRGIKGWPASTSSTNPITRPGSPVLARMYRSAEGYTYANPRVILGCTPQGRGAIAAPSSAENHFAFAQNGSTVYVNTATVLIKRINSTTWLELRWNSMTNKYGVDVLGTASAPYAFELWCSHNTSGTLATTRLAQWDYTQGGLILYGRPRPLESLPGLEAIVRENPLIVDIASDVSSEVELVPATTGIRVFKDNYRYPFVPHRDPMYLEVSLDDDELDWKLWSGYPSRDLPTSRVMEHNSYTLSASLQSLFGSADPGHAGFALGISNADTQSNWRQLANFPPAFHHFEVNSVDQAPVSIPCPMIGDIDTPQQIELRGDLLDPFITIRVPEFQDSPAATSRAQLRGLCSEANPIIIDVASGRIVDSFGANAYGYLQRGSSGFLPFRPGVNVVEVQAADWDPDAKTHAIVRWRDALS